MRIAVLVSGNGTNLQALIDAQSRGALAPGELAAVVSNRPGAHALERARNAGIPAMVVNHQEFESRPAFEIEMHRRLEELSIDAVVLAGFLRILTEEFVNRYSGRLINTHPALCPAFPGIDGPAQAIAHGVKLTGCTVHFVDVGVDTGPIIAQSAVPVLPDDDVPALHKRIQAEEHRLLPQAVQMLAAGRLHIDGRRVHVRPEDAVQ